MTLPPVKTVLVVDDESEILNAIKTFLEDENFEVLTAVDGIDALAILSSKKPDLILMDVMMPKLSGYDVLQQMHRNAMMRDIPVILMSCVRPQVKRSEYEWQHFLKKPFSLDDLLATIERFCHEQG